MIDTTSFWPGKFTPVHCDRCGLIMCWANVGLGDEKELYIDPLLICNFCLTDQALLARDLGLQKFAQDGIPTTTQEYCDAYAARIAASNNLLQQLNNFIISTQTT